jgi:hypothetical protein
VFRGYLLTCGTIALLAASATSADETETFIETFDKGNNEANWQILMSSGQTVVVPDGGNPGAYITNTDQCCWAAPVVRTLSQTSIFTGDFRELGVTSLGLDMIITLAQADPHPDFTMTLMLVHDNGTPGDTSDDTWVYLNIDESIPWPGEGWKSYDFEVPSQLDLSFGELPEGWQFYQDQFGGPPMKNHTWREVMENVSQVWFIGINDPAGIGFLLNWIIGADNIRITYEATKSIPGDLNGDGVVDGADLLILLSEWGKCDDPDDCPADLNNDGVVDGADLLILLSNWG